MSGYGSRTPSGVAPILAANGTTVKSVASAEIAKNILY
jgi:hypothetical protein